jgi:hypothetical protein
LLKSYSLAEIKWRLNEDRKFFEHEAEAMFEKITSRFFLPHEQGLKAELHRQIDRFFDQFKIPAYVILNALELQA